MGAYLAINKTGYEIPVFQYWNNVRIGTIYPNERFTYMTTYIEEAGGGEVLIKFLNSAGSYVDGMCYFNTNSTMDNFTKRWSQFSFNTTTIAGNTAFELHTDNNVAIYTTGGQYITTLPSGSKVYTDQQSTSGASHPDWLFLYGYDRNGYIESQSCFVNTGVASNSMNTPVFGNWW